MERRVQTLVVFLVIGFVPILHSQGSTATQRVERGTLGLVVFTKSGIVMAADSRSTHGNGSFDDHADKVYRLRDASACTIAGTVADQRRFFQQIMGFDFPKKIQRYAHTHGDKSTNSPFDVKSDAEVLGRRLSSALAFGGVDFFDAASPMDDGGTMATVIVAGYSKTNAGPGIPEHPVAEGYKINIIVQTENGHLSPGDASIIRTHWVVGNPSTHFELFTNGNDALIKPILRGTKQDWTVVGSDGRLLTVDLRAIRANPAIKTYLDLDASHQLEQMSLQQAVEFADALISENIRAAGKALAIGGQVDVATITPDKGFAWVPGHEPQKKHP